MNSKVTIKSLSNGIKLFLDADCSFTDIIEEINFKFSQSKNFFKGGKIAISYEGRNLSSDEEHLLINSIEDSAEIKIMYVICKDSLTEESFAKAVSRPMQDIQTELSIGKIYSGSLKRGDKIKSEAGIIILGDIEPGASIVSGGSVIILGGLYGTAICDSRTAFDKCFIYANDFNPEKIQIGSFTYYPKEKPKWVVKPKMISKMAYIFNHDILVDNVQKDSILKLCNLINKE